MGDRIKKSNIKCGKCDRKFLLVILLIVTQYDVSIDHDFFWQRCFLLQFATSTDSLKSGWYFFENLVFWLKTRFCFGEFPICVGSYKSRCDKPKHNHFQTLTKQSAQRWIRKKPFYYQILNALRLFYSFFFAVLLLNARTFRSSSLPNSHKRVENLILNVGSVCLSTTLFHKGHETSA